MHLSTVDIKNFSDRSSSSGPSSKQAGDVTVGRNNTGKTNLRKAIRHVRPSSCPMEMPFGVERDDFYRE